MAKPLAIRISIRNGVSGWADVSTYQRHAVVGYLGHVVPMEGNHAGEAVQKMWLVSHCFKAVIDDIVDS